MADKKKEYIKHMSGGLWKYEGENESIVLTGNVQKASEIDDLKKKGKKEPYKLAKKYPVTVFKNEDATGSQPVYNLVVNEVKEEEDDLPF